MFVANKELNMEIPFIDLYSQYCSIKEEIDNAIADVIKNSSYIGGKYLKLFEEQFANYLGTRHCIGVANGTDALTITLKMLGMGEGDEVITAANSFIASSEAITNAGARVVFADNNPEYYTIDPGEIEKRITPKTRAIIPVHLHGHPADMDRIMEIADKHNIYIIEDSAQAHGAEYHGIKVGNFGIAATFSFYPGKNLGAYGDGGVIVTNNDELSKKVRMYANHGRVAKYNHEFEGVNSRLDGLQAAILSVKLKHLDEWIYGRRRVAHWYSERLKNIEEVILPKEQSNVKHVYHLYVIRTKNRDKLCEYLAQNGIATGIHYPIALPNLNAYSYLGHNPLDFPVASKYQDELLSLPIYPEILDEQVDYICDKIIKFFR